MLAVFRFVPGAALGAVDQFGAYFLALDKVNGGGTLCGSFLDPVFSFLYTGGDGIYKDPV
jgi:hypothetical protein